MIVLNTVTFGLIKYDVLYIPIRLQKPIELFEIMFNINPTTEALFPANSHSMLALHMGCKGYQ
jgi:hypothetical protein